MNASYLIFILQDTQVIKYKKENDGNMMSVDCASSPCIFATSTGRSGDRYVVDVATMSGTRKSDSVVEEGNTSEY